MVKKVLYIFLISIICLNILKCNIVYADKDITGDGIISGAKGFIDDGKSGAVETLNEEELRKASNSIYNILLAIAMVVAVTVGVILGIKFMTSSVEEQAKIKEVLVPYVAGCIVVFGSIGIWNEALNIFSKL